MSIGQKDTSTRLRLAYAGDTFLRPNLPPSSQITNGWGSASDGEQWSGPTGGGQVYALTNGRGSFTGNTTGALLTLGSGSLTQAESIVRFSISSGSAEVALVLRSQSGSYYRLRYKSSNLSLIRVTHGQGTTLLTTNASYTAGGLSWLRFRVVTIADGTVVALLGKYWRDGTSEPVAWTLSVLDSSVAVLTNAGAYGLYVQLHGVADTATFSLYAVSDTPLLPQARDLSTRALLQPGSTWDLATRIPLLSKTVAPNLVSLVIVKDHTTRDLKTRIVVLPTDNDLFLDVTLPILTTLYQNGWNTQASAKQHSQTYLLTGGLWINWSPSINWSHYSLLFDINYPLSIDNNALSHGETTANNHDPQVCLDYLAAICRYKAAFPNDTQFDLPNQSGYMGISQMVDHLTAQGTGLGAGDFKPQLGATNYGGYSNPKGWVYFSLLSCYEVLQNSPLLTAQQVQNLLQSTLYAAWTYYNQWYFHSISVGGTSYTTNTIFNTGNGSTLSATLSAPASPGDTSLVLSRAMNASGKGPTVGTLTLTDTVNGNETLTYYGLGPSITTLPLATPVQFAHDVGTAISVPPQTTYTYSPSQSLLCAAALIDASWRFPSLIQTGMFYSATNAPQSPALWVQAGQNVVAAVLGTRYGYASSLNPQYGLLYTIMGTNAGLAGPGQDVPMNTQAKIENNGEVVEGLVRLGVLLLTDWLIEAARLVVTSAWRYLWDAKLGGFFFAYDMKANQLQGGYKETRSTALMLRGIHALNEVVPIYGLEEQEIVSLLCNQYLLQQQTPGYTYRLTPNFSVYVNSYQPHWNSYLTQDAPADSSVVVSRTGTGSGLGGTWDLLYLGANTPTEEMVVFGYPPQGTGPYSWTVNPKFGGGTGVFQQNHKAGDILEAPPPVNAEVGYTMEAMASTIEHLLFTLTPVDYPAGYGPNPGSGPAPVVPGPFDTSTLPLFLTGMSFPLPIALPLYGWNGSLLPDQPYLVTGLCGTPGVLSAGGSLLLCFVNPSSSTQELLADGSVGVLTFVLADLRVVSAQVRLGSVQSGVTLLVLATLVGDAPVPVYLPVLPTQFL